MTTAGTKQITPSCLHAQPPNLFPSHHSTQAWGMLVGKWACCSSWASGVTCKYSCAQGMLSGGFGRAFVFPGDNNVTEKAAERTAWQGQMQSHGMGNEVRGSQLRGHHGTRRNASSAFRYCDAACPFRPSCQYNRPQLHDD